MNHLKTIRDIDIGSSIPTPEKFKERKASRAVVFDKGNKVALFHATNNGYHKLPGGEIEEGEDIESALRREVMEEIGCEIKNIRELGEVEEFRNGEPLHQLSFCFIADILGEKGEPHLEEGEKEEGFVTEWVDLETAIKVLENEMNVENYEGKFIQMRDLTFLEEAKKMLIP